MEQPHADEEFPAPAQAGEAVVPPRRRWRIWPWLLLSVLCLGVTFLGVLYFGLRQEPEFYRQSRAALADPAVRTAAIKELQAQTEQLQAAVENRAEWQLELTDRQINAWLQEEFTRQLRHDEPQFVRDPVVELQAGLVRIGATLDAAEFRGVLSIEIRPRLVEDSQLEFELGAVRAGLLPIPAARWIARFRDEINRSEWPLKIVNDAPLRVRLNWREIGSETRTLEITGLEVSDGRLRLTGRPAVDSANPP